VPGEVGVEGAAIEVEVWQVGCVVVVAERRQLLANLRLGEPLGVEEGLHELPVLEDEGGQRPLLTGELLGVLQGALEDEPCHRVDVRGGYLTPQAHGLQGDRTAAGKGVEDPGRPATVRLADLLPEPFQCFGVLRLPLPVEDAAFGLLLHPLHDPAARHALTLDLFHHPAADLFAERLALL